MGFIRLAAVSVIGAAVAFAAPVAASAAPGSPSKPHPTTTTTTAPSKNAQAFAKLVIKPASVGHVSVKTANGSAFKPAKDGQSLHVGDTIQTDATGQAEIDYADNAYTRLDVNTTFTIKKLTDSQGNRQVEGSLDVGRTYNRTAALTQSQTFQQDAGGATAAVAGTAFVVTCTGPTTCTFTAVYDITNVTDNGVTKKLNPLDECVDTNGALCGTTTRLTPDEVALIQWIQTNVLLDLTEHGIGDGVFQPFAATVVVSGAVVQSFTPSTPNQGFQPQTPPPPADNDLAISTAPNQSTMATGPSGAPVTFSKPTASDEGGETPAVTCDHSSGGVFAVGSTTVTCTASDFDDSNGPVHSTFTVTVTDGDLAIGTAPPQSATAPSNASTATVAYTKPTATDEGGQTPPVVCDHNNTFPVGTTTVTCTATDADDANGPVQSTFTVTVSPDPQTNQSSPVNMHTNGDDGIPLNFQLTGGTDSGQAFKYQYTTLNLANGTLTDGTNSVATMTPYDPSTHFIYTPTVDPASTTPDSFQYQVKDTATAAVSPTTTVNLHVQDADSDDDGN